MVGQALAGGRGGDQEHRLGAGERGGQARGVGVVGAPHVDAAVGEVREALGGPPGRDDLRGGRAAAEELLHDEAAELARGSGDDE